MWADGMPWTSHAGGGPAATRWADIALRLPSTTERWNSEAFGCELHRWVADAVGEPRRLEPVRVRPWATVWQAETERGVSARETRTDRVLDQVHRTDERR